MVEDEDAPLRAVDVNRTIRDLMDAAKVAIGPSMPAVEKDEARALLTALLVPVERMMPTELQGRDARIWAAKNVLQFLSR